MNSRAFPAAHELPGNSSNVQLPSQRHSFVAVLGVQSCGRPEARSSTPSTLGELTTTRSPTTGRPRPIFGRGLRRSTSERGKEIHGIAVGIEKNGVTLAPYGVEGRLVPGEVGLSCADTPSSTAAGCPEIEGQSDGGVDLPAATAKSGSKLAMVDSASQASRSPLSKVNSTCGASAGVAGMSSPRVR